jgi:hypothetical protein
LLCAQTGEIGDDELEPQVPPGLADLDGSLERLVEFLRVDTDLLEVAAAVSPPMQVQSLTLDAIREWIEGQTSAQRDRYLERFIAAEDPALAAELQRAILTDTVRPLRPSNPRSVGALPPSRAGRWR